MVGQATRQREGDLQVVFFGQETGHHDHDGQDLSPGTMLVKLHGCYWEVRFLYRTTSKRITQEQFAKAWYAARTGPISPKLLERALLFGLK